VNEEDGSAQPTAVSGEDGVYRGMNNYRDFRAGFRREHTVGAEKGSGAHGPLRASTNVRMTVRVDYQPDICKDYKETGYCGYGDACKFMHDRGDYKSGWEIDRVSYLLCCEVKPASWLAGWLLCARGCGCRSLRSSLAAIHRCVVLAWPAAGLGRAAEGKAG
jgi:hypothetical protein